MDSTSQTFDFYVGGNPVAWDSPNGIGSNVPTGRALPQSLDWIGFGVESFGGAATTIGGEFDDILVSSTRVGCGSPPGPITTTTTESTTTSTTATSTTTTEASCGFIPDKCGKAITRN